VPERTGRLRRAEVGVALLVSGPAVLVVADLVAWPTSAQEWLAYAGPLGLALAVVVSRSRPAWAVAVLGLVTAVAYVPTSEVLFAGSPLAAVATLVLAFAGVGWVTATLAGRCRPRLAIPVIAAWALVTVVGQGTVDASLLGVGLGGWAVGRIVRARRLLATQLRARADELLAEQAHYAAEAVRLERATIARELHDVVAHCMTVIVIQAQAGRALMTHDPVHAVETVEAILASAREAETDVATLATLVDAERPRPLDRVVLEELVTRARSTGAPVEVSVVGDLATIDPDVSVAAHRALQEALTNAFRHAPGAKIAIEVVDRPFLLRVRNGPAHRAIALAGLGAGHGLVGMDARMARLGLRADGGRVADGGWEVRVSEAHLVGAADQHRG